ncbi:TPA: hypothetical protein U1236_000379 [Streptococcus suis]|nr:hypothetical protein [Streptococcus suis]
MVTFTELYNKFEKTSNLVKFEEEYSENNVATRFLLIRSFDAPNLKNLLKAHEISYETESLRELMEKVYNSKMSNNEIVIYIKEKRVELIEKREQEAIGLKEFLDSLTPGSAGIRDDNVNSLVSKFVRDKSIKDIDELSEQLNRKILPRIKKYILWSFFNQTANDLIELIFLKHSKIIPTLRKIHDIDFFIEFEDGNIIPFDLKVTHISDSYFDLAFQGISESPNDDGSVSFVIDNTKVSELQYIKNYYIDFKKEKELKSFSSLGNKAEKIRILENTLGIKIPHGIKTSELTENYKDDYDKLVNESKLPNLSDFSSKAAIIEYLSGFTETEEFISTLKEKRRSLVESTASELQKLEWWNYKFQGERLFSNNNRIFLFFTYLEQFSDAKILKGKIEKFQDSINLMLDSLTNESVHNIKYYYDKDATHNGEYFCKSFSMIYYE